MKTTYGEIALNMRLCAIREDWCAKVEAAGDLQGAVESCLDHGENQPHPKQIGPVPWAATFATMFRAALQKNV